MGRRSDRWNSNVYNIYIIGEQLRVQMHSQGQVKDRRYHLRKYKTCFIGREVVDWLLKMFHVQSRSEAVRAMQTLKNHGVLHHVVDEQDFQDQHLFYRFTFDDDTYKLNKDLASFYRGVNIYRKMKANKEEVLKDLYHKGSLYSEVFLGCDAVDFIVVSEQIQERDLVIQEFRDLLESDIIKHVTDDYHFSDDKLMYEFALDLNKPCLLQDVLDMLPQRQTNENTTPAAAVVEMNKVIAAELEVKTCSVQIRSLKKPVLAARDSVDSGLFGSNTRAESNRPGSTSVTSRKQKSKSVLGRAAIDEQLENHESPYVKRIVKMNCDEQGFGFVLRGSSPCYVQTVDPLGPAAAAGLKVRQFICALNGQNVLCLDHREVGQMMAQTSKLTLTVFMNSCHSDRS